MKEIQLHRIDLNLLVVFEALMMEGSVAAAAEKLGKTPSAISHALSRFREQVGDPLLVRVGGRMQPSPFALTLIEDVRPILRSIKRVLAPPETFDPATSTRVFRVACPISGQLLSEVIARVRSEAPGTRLEWLSAPRDVFSAVSEGLIDLALLGGESRLPSGLDEIEASPLIFTSFVRGGHPATADWGSRAWSAYPHVKVTLAHDARSPVDKSSNADTPERSIGALISEFSAVGPLLASSDLIGSLPRIMMAWDMETYGLLPLPPVVPVPPFPVRFYWSSRLGADPAVTWIRDIVVGTFNRMVDESNSRVEARLP